MVPQATDLVRRFEEDGILVIDAGIPESVIDGAVRELERFWSGERPAGSAYADGVRIQGAWNSVPAVRQIATFPNIIETLRLLYGRRPLPFQTLNFRMGSEQRVHPDSIHFNSEPFGMMCGVWVALEDIGPDQGPLVYYPGSHRLPEINFEDAGIEPSYDNYSAYEAFIEKLIEEQAFEPRYGTVRKGQAIIWSANVLHGGSPHRDKRLTRHSQVTHYYFSGCRYWKPGYSHGARHYYTPWWIPYPGAGLEVAKSRARWFLKRRLGSLVGKQKA